MSNGRSSLPLDVFVQSNPALSALVIFWTAKGYAKDSSRNEMLFVWSILALGTIAAPALRKSLPKTANSRLPIFLSKNPGLRASAPTILVAWRDPFWSGLRYGVSKGLLWSDGLQVSARKAARLKKRSSLGAELEKSSLRLGRLLAREGSDESIATLFGLGFAE